MHSVEPEACHTALIMAQRKHAHLRGDLLAVSDFLDNALAIVGAFVDRRHSFGDALALERLIGDAGFEEVHVDRLVRTIRFDDPTLFVRMNTMALVGMSPASSTMNEQERANLVDVIVNESAEVVRQYADADGLSFELGANVAKARA